MRRLRSIALAGGALAAVVAAGCSVNWLQNLSGTEQQVAFPHKPHLAASLECADCHEVDAKSGGYAAPASDTCETCHTKIDAEKPDSRKASRFYVDGKVAAAGIASVPSEVKFDHKTHLAKGLTCASCHGDLAQSESLGAEQRPTMENCTSCHAARGASNECETCHREIRVDREPPSHDAQFLRTHGKDLVGHPSAQQSCERCHASSSCTSCHQTQMPPSHTNQFRRRSHGLLASFDRRECATCHQTDFCSRCHQQEMPSSHTGSWGVPKDRHCLFCHEPVTSESSCSVCHKSTPSHRFAPPKPATHTPGMNCRQCHGLTAPLRHVDNREDCNDCHH
jgi:cytochrome c7-like protein/class III cytochrome C family protein